LAQTDKLTLSINSILIIARIYYSQFIFHSNPFFPWRNSP